MQVTLFLDSEDEVKINEFMKLHNEKYHNDQINIKSAVYRLFIDGLYDRKDKYPELYPLGTSRKQVEQEDDINGRVINWQLYKG